MKLFKMIWETMKKEGVLSVMALTFLLCATAATFVGSIGLPAIMTEEQAVRSYAADPNAYGLWTIILIVSFGSPLVVGIAMTLWKLAWPSK